MKSIKFQPLLSLDFDAHRVFDTSNIDYAVDKSSELLSPHRIKLGKYTQTFRSRMDHISLENVSINRLMWSNPVEVEPEDLDYYLVSIPMTGSSFFTLDTNQFTTSPNQGVIISPQQKFKFATLSNFSQLLIRIDKQEILKSVQKIYGQDKWTGFNSTILTNGIQWESLCSVLRLIGLQQLRLSQEKTVRGVGDHLKELLISNLILNYSNITDGDSSHSYKRLGKERYLIKAESYLADNISKRIKLTDIASHCGVSPRTIQLAFQKEHNCGPIEWLRAQRLSRVRKAIQSQGHSRSLSELSLEYGFNHYGEFSQQYKHAFGESPKDTKRR